VKKCLLYIHPNAVSKSRAQDRTTEERLDWKQNDEDSARESGRVSFGMRGQATERSPETETEESSRVSLAREARLRRQWHRYCQRREDSIHFWLLCTHSNIIIIVA